MSEIKCQDIESLRNYIREHYEEFKNLPRDFRRQICWLIYKILPEDLKDAIFSEKIADINGNLGKKYKFEENVSLFAELIGDVFLGILPLESFQKKLSEKLKLEQEISKALFQETSELIFNPLSASLNSLYFIKDDA